MIFFPLLGLKRHYHDDDNTQLLGGYFRTYRAGSSDPVDTWTDATATTLNAPAVTLDARGEIDSGGMFGDNTKAYKVVLYRSDDSIVWTQDNITELSSGGAGSGNLSGTLTAGKVPVASGAETLVDSAISATTTSASVDGTLDVSGRLDADSAVIGTGGISTIGNTSTGSLQVTGTAALNSGIQLGGNITPTSTGTKNLGDEFLKMLNGWFSGEVNVGGNIYENSALLSDTYAPLSHVSDLDNPHEVTASQLGALAQVESDTTLSGLGTTASPLSVVKDLPYATEAIVNGNPQWAKIATVTFSDDNGSAEFRFSQLGSLPSVDYTYGTFKMVRDGSSLYGNITNAYANTNGTPIVSSTGGTCIEFVDVGSGVVDVYAFYDDQDMAFQTDFHFGFMDKLDNCTAVVNDLTVWSITDPSGTATQLVDWTNVNNGYKFVKELSAESVTASGALTGLSADIGSGGISSDGVGLFENLGTGLSSNIVAKSNYPTITMYENDADTDEKMWEWLLEGGTLYLKTRNDANTAGIDVFSFTRTLINPDLLSIMCDLSVSGEVNTPKIKLTEEGGYAVLFTAETAITAGEVVTTGTVTDNVTQTIAEDYKPIGVAYETVSTGDPIWVVTSGKAYVLLQNSTASTIGNWVKTSDTVGGRVDATNILPPGGTIAALEEHGREVGHCFETKTAGTDVLALCLIHFN